MPSVSDHNLADFLFSDEENLLHPPAGFLRWIKDNSWAHSLFEPKMHGAMGPRIKLERGGETKQVINLSSYNYLGLATHPEVVFAAKAALDQYGTGACGSPILSGMSDIHQRLEHELAEFLGYEACMIFNSGFAGGMGSLVGVLRKGDVAILDEKAHLCLVDGVRLAKAKLVFFKHNDPDSLDEALKNSQGKRRIVAVEGVYSMDGDTVDLPKLMPVIAHHEAPIFLDEAHSILAFGARGRGILEHYGYEGQVGLHFATFSKSFAGAGGFTCGSRDLLHYMRFYINPYGFSCALPPSVVAGVRKGLEVATRDSTLREQLWENTRYFRKHALELGLNLGESQSHVLPIIIGSDRQLLYELTHDMNEKGLFLAPIDYPSVPEDSLRFRVAITAAHRREDLDQALQILKDTVVLRIC